MPWGVIAVVLAACSLLAILLYPFSVRVQFDKQGKASHPIQAGVQLFGWFRFKLPLHLPEESKQSDDGTAQVSDKTNRQDTSRQQKEGRTQSSSPSGGEESDEASLVRMAAGFVKVLFFDTGQKRSKRLGKKIPGSSPNPASIILRSIHTFDKLEWKTQVGTGDALSTAMVVGALWSLKGTVYSFLAGHVRFTQVPKFDIQTSWSKPCFDMRIDCIFRLRIGEIILAWVGETAQAWQKGVHRFGHGKRSSH